MGKFLGLFCLCLFLVVSCGWAGGKRPYRTGGGSPPLQDGRGVSAPTATGRISWGTTVKFRTLDPADGYDLAANVFLNNTGDRLYTYELATNQLKPELATALPKISKDGLTYTIPLRQGVIFHDGTPFNAEAMAFSLKRFMENKGQPSFLLADAVESVQATGEYELTIKLKQQFAAFPALLTYSGLCAISPKYYEIGAGKFKPDTFVGTGPYKLASYGADSLKLEVFDRYWGEKPANKGVDIQRFSSTANLYNSFRTGEVDVAYETLDPDQIRSLEKMAPAQGWKVISAKGNYVTYWLLNVKKPPLDNLNVRKAIAAMINRPLLIERVTKGQAEALYSLIPSTFDVSKPVFKEQYGDGNVVRAKELLGEAGYSRTNPLKLEVWYPSNSPVRVLTASAMKAIADQQLDGILQLEPKGVESTTAHTNLDKGVYQTFLFSWLLDFFDADNYIEPFLSCAKGSAAKGCESGSSQAQGSFYYSDRAKELIARERKEQNPQNRKAIFGEIQDLLASDVPYIPLWQNIEYAFAQKGIDGVRLNTAQPLTFGTISKK